MKAVQFHSYGGPDVLVREDVEPPVIAADEVLIKVRAAGVNPVDAQLRRGDYQTMLPVPLPFIPGWDVAGTIETAGADVSGFKFGQAVFALQRIGRSGAYAEYIAVPARDLAPAPKTIPLEQAAAVPLAALTAWMALFDHAQVQAGQSVLVHAAAGGVGTFAVQLARRAGARVIATASAANLSLLRELGAHEVIDYQAGDFAAGLRDVDVVLDMVGGDTRARSWSVMRRGGLLVAIALPPPDAAVAQDHGVRAAMAMVAPDGARLAEIGRLIDAGEVKVVIDRELPLVEAAAAHRYVEQRHARGKVILRVS